jgi:predicted amidohydrolase
MSATAAAIGRPVRITSISFREKSVSQIAGLVDREGAQGVDLIALPETWTGQKEHVPEILEGETVQTMAALARRHRMYVVCPIDRQDGARRVNTSVLIDRRGQIAGLYDKVYPYWSEFDVRPAVAPGLEAPVFAADLGRVGLAICFDANFPEVWKRLADQGCELVIWSSAYSAGTTLQAHALNHHYYIVTSTGERDCIVYDITGAEIHYSKSDEIHVARVTLDLDRGIYHQNFNLEKRDRLLAEHPDEVAQEQWLEREQWFVLRATRPGVSARALARQYGLEELRDYIERSRREIDAMRGWPFASKVK